MSDDKRINAMELEEENLEKVDGGLSLNDPRHGKDRDPEPETLPTGERTFTIKSTLATGETITAATQMQDGEQEEKTGKRLPKIIFRDRGKSI